MVTKPKIEQLEARLVDYDPGADIATINIVSIDLNRMKALPDLVAKVSFTPLDEREIEMVAIHQHASKSNEAPAAMPDSDYTIRLAKRAYRQIIAHMTQDDETIYDVFQHTLTIPLHN